MDPERLFQIAVASVGLDRITSPWSLTLIVFGVGLLNSIALAFTSAYVSPEFRNFSSRTSARIASACLLLWSFLALTVPGCIALNHVSAREILISDGWATYLYLAFWLILFSASCFPFWVLKRKQAHVRKPVSDGEITEKTLTERLPTFIFLVFANASAENKNYSRDKEHSIVVYALGQTLELAEYHAIKHLEVTGWENITVRDRGPVDLSRMDVGSPEHRVAARAAYENAQRFGSHAIIFTDPQ